jgi:hypothetical protein
MAAARNPSASFLMMSPVSGARELHGALYQIVQHILEIEGRAAAGFESFGSRAFASMSLFQLSLQLLDQLIRTGSRIWGMHQDIQILRSSPTAGT